MKIQKKLESSSKKKINWDKYLAGTTNQGQNRYLDFPIDPNFSKSK